MPPSSISSSDGWDRARRWRTLLLLVLLALAGIETALRLPQVRALLPARTHFYHPAVTRRIDVLERTLMVHQRVDVLFIGSSIVLTNVHPLIFDHLLHDAARPVVSFNAGLPGLWPTSVQLYLEHLWLPMARPRLVIQGVRYPELAARTHAKNDDQVWSGRVEAGWGEAGPLTRAFSAAASRLHLLQYRGAMVTLFQLFRDGRPGDTHMEEEERVGARGYAPLGGPAQALIEMTPDLPNDGTCDGGACEVGFAALRRAIAASRAAGAAYVLLNVPEHGLRWRDPESAVRYTRYIEGLHAFAEHEGVPFIDPTDGDASRFDAMPYNDLAHMTASGARTFTAVVASRMTPVVIATLGALPPSRLADGAPEPPTPRPEPVATTGTR